MMRKWLFVAMVPVLALGGATRQSSTRFSPEERARLVEYWSSPDRYRVAIPTDVREKGLYQVRLTPAGSEWILKYNRARRASAPPTQDAPSLTPEQQDWERWLVAKVAWDRFQAADTARRLNQELLGRDLPRGDKTIPESQPIHPGPAPEGMVALAGNPPSFATCVSPMDHLVRLEDEPLRLQDHFRPGNPRYAYYRFHEGVGDDGTPMKELPPSQVRKLLTMAGVDESQARILRAVSALEGGFDAINTYDTGYVSIGFIQFASLGEGAGSLGRMMLGYRQEQPDNFYTDFRRFGLDVADDGRLVAVDPTTGVELVGPDANLRIIADKRLVAIFQRAGRVSDDFNAFQVKAALKEYWPGGDSLTFNLDGYPTTFMVSDLIRSEAGMATLLDRKVNTGKIDLLTSVCERIARENDCRSLEDLQRLEREIVVAMRYRKDYLADPSLSQPNPSRAGMKNPSRSGGRGLRTGTPKQVATQPIAPKPSFTKPEPAKSEAKKPEQKKPELKKSEPKKTEPKRAETRKSVKSAAKAVTGKKAVRETGLSPKATPKSGQPPQGKRRLSSEPRKKQAKPRSTST